MDGIHIGGGAIGPIDDTICFFIDEMTEGGVEYLILPIEIVEDDGELPPQRARFSLSPRWARIVGCFHSWSYP